jgi:hypothetical protein
MPKGSIFAVDFISDGRIIQFVNGMGKAQDSGSVPGNLTARVCRVRESIRKLVTKAQQAQLPRVYRELLQGGGNRTHSPMTSLPTKAQPESESVGSLSRTVVGTGNKFPASRYLPEDAHAREKFRFAKLSKQGTLAGPKLHKEGKRHKSGNYVQRSLGLQRDKKEVMSAGQNTYVSPQWQIRDAVFFSKQCTNINRSSSMPS